MIPRRSLFIVAAGGLVGSGARVALSLLMSPSNGFPADVLLANLSGSFLLGFLWARWVRTRVSPMAVGFWAIGVLGSFTTFSAFAVGSIELLDAGRIVDAAIYVVVSVMGGLSLAVAGQRLGARMG